VVRKALITAVVVVSLASQLEAQSTSTPAFLAPYRSFNRLEFGGTLSDPGAGFALEGFYRFGHKRYDLGFRAGFQDPGPGSSNFLAGVDFRTRVIDHTSDFPLDGAFTAGVGGSFGNGASQGYIPIGLSLGRRVQLEDSNVEFVPYIHPVLTPSFGDAASDVLFGLGLGVDMTFNKRFDLRVSGGLGDYSGIAISFAILR
jgi:hypothetical protein